MIKLMKYELRKTLFVKLIVLAATALAEIVFLIGVLGDRERMTGTGIVLLTMLAMGGIMVIGLASVVTLHRDVSTKQSYMLFMTPNSSYSILGAKMLENGLSILLTGACFFALGALDITLLFAHEKRLDALWNTIRQFLEQFNEQITLDLPTMLSLAANMICSWISTVTAMYLGVVIANALLKGKRFSGFVSFLVIIALLWLIGYVQVETLDASVSFRTAYWADTGIALGFSVIMYILAAQIMERKLSV